jgi:hypothetical protein
MSEEKIDQILVLVNNIDKNQAVLSSEFTQVKKDVSGLQKEIYGEEGETGKGIKSKIEKVTGIYAVIYTGIMAGFTGVVSFIIHKIGDR